MVGKQVLKSQFSDTFISGKKTSNIENHITRPCGFDRLFLDHVQRFRLVCLACLFLDFDFVVSLAVQVELAAVVEHNDVAEHRDEGEH